MSRLIRGAWIETFARVSEGKMVNGRASYGARGLKHSVKNTRSSLEGRASYGARGLKP